MAKLPNANPETLKLGAKEPTLLFALQDLIKTGGCDFDEWWDTFKLGFPKRVTSKKTNYPVKDWIKPKYIELVPLSEENKAGIREIEYFPNADDETVSYLIRGNDRDLIFHITAIGYQQSGGSEKISSKNARPTLKGFPAIELYFFSDDGKRGVKIIRCKGYTDDKKIADMKLAKLIKPADILAWSTKIKTIFGDTKYKWAKGTECLSYSGQIARLQGLEGHAFVRTEKDGIDLFTAMLKIFDAVPDKDGFNFSGKTSKEQFSKIPKTTEVLSKPVKLDSERPIVDCYFYSAQLRLPLLKKPIPLVKKNVILYKG